MTLPVKITASTVPSPSPMICLVNTSPMIPDVQKQVTSKTFLPIPMPLPSLSPIVAASASAGFGICNNSYNLNSFPFKIASINTQKQ